MSSSSLKWRFLGFRQQTVAAPFRRLQSRRRDSVPVSCSNPGVVFNSGVVFRTRFRISTPASGLQSRFRVSSPAMSNSEARTERDGSGQGKVVIIVLDGLEKVGMAVMTDRSTEDLGRDLAVLPSGSNTGGGRPWLGLGGVVSGGRSWDRAMLSARAAFGHGLVPGVVGNGFGQTLVSVIIGHGFGHGWTSDYGPIREGSEMGGRGWKVGWICGAWMEYGMMVDGGKGGWSWDPGSNVVSVDVMATAT